jgi:hypothetical protein
MKPKASAFVHTSLLRLSFDYMWKKFYENVDWPYYDSAINELIERNEIIISTKEDNDKGNLWYKWPPRNNQFCSATVSQLDFLTLSKTCSPKLVLTSIKPSL